MAQLNNLIVTGSSRFLNKINGVCTDGTDGTTKYMRQDGTWQVPPNDNTDTKVTQTASDSSNADYEILLSNTADNTTRTEGTRKSSSFTYNPNTKSVLIGTLKSGTSLGSSAIAFGDNVQSSGTYSYAEGYGHVASSFGSHAEGENNTVNGRCAHAEGSGTTADGWYSHSEGEGTIAKFKSQHVFGDFNTEDPSTTTASGRGNYVEIVGNGTTGNARSNARTLDWSGNEWVAGNLTLGGTTSDITLNGTNNTWDGTNTSLKSAFNNITDEKVKQTNYITSSYTGDTFTLPFSKDNTSTTGTSDLYKNTGIVVKVSDIDTCLMTMDPGSSEDTTLNAAVLRSQGVQVMNRTSATSIPDSIIVTSTDIRLTGQDNTWDGTNTNLKTALTKLTSRTYFGTCSTEASTSAKVVVCPEFTTSMADCPAGTTIKVKFTNGNTATNPTLNVNSKGAISILKYGTEVPGNSKARSWRDSSIISFTYDGTNWIMNNINDFANVTSVTIENPSSSTTYWLTFCNDNPSASGAYGQKCNDGLRYISLEGTTSEIGQSTLLIGNSVASGTVGNKKGVLRIYNANNKYSKIVYSDSATANREITIPGTAGTLLNTGNTSFTQTVTSGTALGTIKINSVDTVIYAPTTSSSSRKIKKNIQKIENDEINKILQLDAVKFDFKESDTDNAEHRGFIAEDVAQILPNLTTDEVIDDKGNLVTPMQLNYMEMIPYLVEICKKQQQEIDRLKSLITEK